MKTISQPIYQCDLCDTVSDDQEEIEDHEYDHKQFRKLELNHKTMWTRDENDKQLRTEATIILLKESNLTGLIEFRNGERKWVHTKELGN